MNDYSLNQWINQTCGGDACTSEQMYQTSPTYYDCYTAEQCFDDPCTSWSDVSCGGGACLESQMYQIRSCTLGCADEDQCYTRTLGHPQSGSVSPALGNGEQIFTFSWTPPAASTCPVAPLTYFLAFDKADDFSDSTNGTTYQKGPFAHGNHRVWIKVQDAVGRESQAPYPSRTFEVDALGPEAPEVTVCP